LFRAFGYYKNLGLQTTGTVDGSGFIKATLGPRLKLPYGQLTLELYFGLWGVKSMSLSDISNNHRIFWARCTIPL